jgi:hypothetical protein
MLITVTATTVAWFAVTLLTRPEPREKLVEFYERVRPAGPGWEPIRLLVGDDARPSESLAHQFINWVLGCTLIYASLFGIGYLVFKEWLWGASLTALALICGVAISQNLAPRDHQAPGQ